MSESYDLWHFDGKRPEVLASALPDKGACRRMWRNSSHAAIVRDGLLLEPKPTCDAKKARAIASAAAEAHRSATGAAPVPAFIGPVNCDGKRALEMDTRGKGSRLAVLAAATEPMPAKYVPAPVEEVPPVDVTPLPETLDEAPAPVVVVTRKPTPAPAPETPMPAAITTGRCPCGEPSAPTCGHNGGGRPSRPEFADFCTVHRNSAVGRRARTGASAAEVRAWVLALIAGQPASKPSKSAPSKARASKPRPSKPAPSKRAAVEAPVADLLAMVRRQRAVVDALGGIDQAEAIAAAAARVGGPVALVQLVDELAGAVS